ncbi:choice-of-anchor R domain-containing protein [Haloferula chungangensis]|uniref:Choice-of-anchor R domain-containing protein n=1 Tax=Haloferula chungangensis TaxID=1048331 RepID=A0ABW2L7E8_9BACT
MKRSNFCAAVAFATLVVPLQAESQTTLYDSMPAPFVWTPDELGTTPEGGFLTAQGFTTGPDGAVGSVSLPLARIGSPDGQVSVEIWDEDSGHPGSKVASLGVVGLSTLNTNDEGGSIILFQDPVTGLLPHTTYYLLIDSTGATIPDLENTFFMNTTEDATGTNGGPKLQLQVPGEEWVFAPDVIEGEPVDYLVMSVESPKRATLCYEQASLGFRNGPIDPGRDLSRDFETYEASPADLSISEGSSNFRWDNFILPQAEVLTKVRWTCLFVGNGSSPPSDEGKYRVAIWADKNGEVDHDGLNGFIHEEIRPATEVQRSDDLRPLVWNGTSYPAHELSLEFVNPFELAANTRYWLSVEYIHPEGNSHAPFHYWACGSAGPGPVKQMSWAEIIHPLQEVGDPWRHAAFSLYSTPVNDTDNDSMEDGWEEREGLDPTTDDAFDDPDNDGSNNLQEYENRTDPHEPDSDGDGLLDGVETKTGIYVDATNTGTYPNHADSDFDGLSDGAEIPMAGDSQATNPNLRDTDGDGFGDSLERQQNLAPNDPDSFPSFRYLGTGNEALMGGGLTTGSSAAEISHESFDFFGVSSTPNSLFDNQLGGDFQWKTRSADRTGIFPYLYAQVTFPEAIVLSHFTISSGNRLGNNPLAFEIQGSNDGTHFETIFHWANPGESIWTTRDQVVRFDSGTHFRLPAAYRVIRFSTHHYSDVQLGSEFVLGEIELFGTSEPLRINSVAPLAGENAVKLSWNSLELPDVRYLVERSFDLETWETIASDVSSEGASTSFIDSNFEALPTRVFYRISDDE